MEATVKRLASLLAILLTFLTVNPSLANASAPDRELLHNGHADVAHVEWDQASGRPTIKILWNESELKEAKDVYIRLGPDADANGQETSRLKVPDDPRFSFLGEPATSCGPPRRGRATSGPRWQPHLAPVTASPTNSWIASNLRRCT